MELYRRHNPGDIAQAKDKPALPTISSKRDQQWSKLERI